ncbi:MAG: hypothetical protein H0W02_17625 [Ktedonobacteraceae bacterium]|nr:hypothetical protein [Ktedonobacteraceae bacterium]
MAEFSMPDFSVPDLTSTDLTFPVPTFPDPTRPDPPLPDLLTPAIPAELDRPPVNEPAPALPDLTDPLIPGDLHMPDASASEYTESLLATIDVPMSKLPGELADAAMELVHASPDSQNLPAGLTYAKDYTTQEEMTHRLRHLATLILGLDGKVPVNDQ